MNRTFPFGLCLLIVFALAALAGCSRGTSSGPASSPPSSFSFSSPTPAGVSSSAQVVKVNPLPVEITRAGSTDATVKLLISPGFHINANPATFPYLIPTELTAGKVEEIIVGKPTYPTAEKKKFQFADKPLAVYEGEVQIRLPLRTEDMLSDREVSLPISVRVQACDNEKCYAPDTINTWISVHWKYCCDD